VRFEEFSQQAWEWKVSFSEIHYAPRKIRNIYTKQ
jgi:hypothetical protein